MGRQINFFMSKLVEKEFFDLLCRQGYSIFYEDYKEKRIRKVMSYDELDESMWLILLYKDVYGSLTYLDNEKLRIDKLNCSVIEWCRTVVNVEEKTVKRGRIWMSDLINFESSEKETQFKKDFNSLMRWIRKNVPRQENNHNGYIIKEYINDEIIYYMNKGYQCNI